MCWLLLISGAGCLRRVGFISALLSLSGNRVDKRVGRVGGLRSGYRLVRVGAVLKAFCSECPAPLIVMANY